MFKSGRKLTKNKLIAVIKGNSPTFYTALSKASNDKNFKDTVKRVALEEKNKRITPEVEQLINKIKKMEGDELYKLLNSAEQYL